MPKGLCCAVIVLILVGCGLPEPRGTYVRQDLHSPVAAKPVDRAAWWQGQENLPNPGGYHSNFDTGWSHYQHGIGSAARMPGLVLGRLISPDLPELRTLHRYEQGLVIILPGIEGHSTLNTGMAQGLGDGGWPGAVVIYDWTTGYSFLSLYHLCGYRRNQQQAAQLAEAITAYQDMYPGRPVYLVGHSGGGGMVVLTLECLPANRCVTGAVLLAAALSPRHDMRQALERTKCGIWNFYSYKDIVFLMAGTTLFGTIDRCHTPSAGFSGFRPDPRWPEADLALYAERLHQQSYMPAMITSFNFGGHAGCANRAFVRAWIAPLLDPRSSQ